MVANKRPKGTCTATKTVKLDTLYCVREKHTGKKHFDGEKLWVEPYAKRGQGSVYELSLIHI